MRGSTKTEKILLDGYGNLVCCEKGCIVVKHDEEEERYPLLEGSLSEIILTSGNTISVGALNNLSTWGVTVIFANKSGRPVSILKNLNDDSNVRTRIQQYKAVSDGRGFEIAKQLVLGKIKGQNTVLAKYGLETDFRPLDSVERLPVPSSYSPLRDSEFDKYRNALLNIEAKMAERYFGQIFSLFDESIRPEKRSTYRAYDCANNLFNLGYDILFSKCYMALLKAKVEPYLGFLHNVQYGRLSLVCDLQELYRHLVDDFLIQYSKGLTLRDFKAKEQKVGDKKGKRMFLESERNKDMTSKLHQYFTSYVSVPRKQRGKRQELESLIAEESLLLAKFLRNERREWVPRIAIPN